MTLKIEVITSAKGSNPGGKAIIYDRNKALPVYMKHVFGARLGRTSSFNGNHQPIYEAVTIQMMKKLGLYTPEIYVLLNKEKDIIFSYDVSIDKKKSVRPDRPFYFISQWITPPQSENLEEADKIMEREAIYRDFLQVADIVGRKQNYFFLNESSGRLFYLDVGRSFVHAVGGFLMFKGNSPKLIRGHKLKDVLKHLKNYYLICNDNDKMMCIEDIALMPYHLYIPTLNPNGSMKLNELLSAEEIDEIVGRIASGLEEEIKKYKDSSLLIKE